MGGKPTQSKDLGSSNLYSVLTILAALMLLPFGAAIEGPKVCCLLWSCVLRGDVCMITDEQMACIVLLTPSTQLTQLLEAWKAAAAHPSLPGGGAELARYLIYSGLTFFLYNEV